MNDDDLRALVRAALAQQAGTPTAGPASRAPALAGAHLHPSHGMFAVPVGSDADGPCLIEPAVLCTHCGYCRSYGH